MDVPVEAAKLQAKLNHETGVQSKRTLRTSGSRQDQGVLKVIVKQELCEQTTSKRTESTPPYDPRREKRFSVGPLSLTSSEADEDLAAMRTEDDGLQSEGKHWSLDMSAEDVEELKDEMVRVLGPRVRKDVTRKESRRQPAATTRERSPERIPYLTRSMMRQLEAGTLDPEAVLETSEHTRGGTEEPAEGPLRTKQRREKVQYGAREEDAISLSSDSSLTSTESA